MKKNSQNSSSYGSVLAIMFGLLIFYYIYELDILLIIALSLCTLSLLSHKIGLLIHKAWMALAMLLSRIISPIILSVFFYFFLFPIALLSKVFRKSIIVKKDTLSSMYSTINKNFSKTDFEETW